MGANQPLVSIGVPVYNGATFLRDALDSLLAQDYENFEMIVSDNASTDGTADICREYADRDPRIQFYQNSSNLGPMFNFRRTFDLSRGRYYLWAGDHDLWHSGFINSCVKVLEKDNRVVLAYPRTLLIDNKGNIIGLMNDQIDTRGLTPLERFRKIIWELGYCNMFYGVFRADTLKKITFPRRVALGADNVILAEISLHGSIAQIPAPLFYRRENRPGETPYQAIKRRIEMWKKAGYEYEAIIPHTLLAYSHFEIIDDSNLDISEKDYLFEELKRCFIPRYKVQMQEERESFLITMQNIIFDKLSADEKDIFSRLTKAIKTFSSDIRLENICKKIQNASNIQYVTSPVTNQQSGLYNPKGTVSVTILDQVYDFVQNNLSGDHKDVTIWILERIVAKDPAHAETHHALGLLFYEQGLMENAHIHLQQAEQLAPGNPVFVKDLGDFFQVAQNDAHQALRMYAKLIQLQPNNHEVLLTAGHLYLSQQQFDRARLCYQRILEHDPDNVEVRERVVRLAMLKETENKDPSTPSNDAGTFGKPVNSNLKKNISFSSMKLEKPEGVMAEGKLPISVIVPLSKNRYDFFRHYVHPLIKANNPAEIIIIDDEGLAPKKRNDGFKKSTQPFVFFCDDDILLPNNYLATLLKNLQKNMLRSDKRIGYTYTGYNGIVLNPSIHPMKGNYEVESIPFNPTTIRQYNYISTMSLMDRAVFPFFDETINRLQDWDLYLTLLENGIEGVLTENLKFFAYYLDDGITSFSTSMNDAVDAIRKKHSIH